MVESFVMIQEDYKKIYQLWAEIAESEADEVTDEDIICDNLCFEDYDEWRNTACYQYSCRRK